MCDQFQTLKSNPQFGFRLSACLNQSCESALMTLPDFLFPLPLSFSSDFCLPLSVCSLTLLYWNHISLPLSHFAFFSLPLELRGGGTDPALPDWRGNHSHSSTDHLCLHHADLHSFPLGSPPPVSAFPHLLISE